MQQSAQSAEGNFQQAFEKFLLNEAEGQELIEALIPFLNEQMAHNKIDRAIELSDSDRQVVATSLESCRTNYNAHKVELGSKIREGWKQAMIIGAVVGVAGAVMMGGMFGFLSMLAFPGSPAALGVASMISASPVIGAAVGAVSTIGMGIRNSANRLFEQGENEAKHQQHKTVIVKQAIYDIKGIAQSMAKEVNSARSRCEQVIGEDLTSEQKDKIIESNIRKALDNCMKAIPQQLQTAISSPSGPTRS